MPFLAHSFAQQFWGKEHMELQHSVGVWGPCKLVSDWAAIQAPLQSVDNAAPWAGSMGEVLLPELFPQDPVVGEGSDWCTVVL